MWRSCHSVPLPSATPSVASVASVATQTDHGFLPGHGIGAEGAQSQSYHCHRSYNFDLNTRHQPFPHDLDGRRCLSGQGFQMNETGEIGTTIYEEIILHRCRKDAKFGLTLWYQTGSEVNCQSEGIKNYDNSGTKVYIGEIEPGGSAAKDGRARIGDRIIQINGESVKSRDQVLNLLRSDIPFICLLLSRSSLVGQGDDGFTDDLDALECLSFEDDKEHGAVQLECIDEEDGATDDTGTTENDSQRQDSGFGKTDESTRNEESSEQEAIDDCVISPLADADCSFHECHQKSSDSFGSMDWHESDADGANQDELPSIFQCQQFYEMLKERCNADLVSSARISTCRKSSKTNRHPASTVDDYAVLERPRHFDDVAILGREVDALHLEGHTQSQYNRSVMATRKVPRMGTKIEFCRQINPSCSKEKTSFMEQYCMKEKLPHDFVSDHGQTRVISQSNAGRSAGECRVFDSLQNFVKSSLAGSNNFAPGRSKVPVQLPDTEAKASNKPSGHGSNSVTCIRKTQTSQMCQTDDEGEYESLIPLNIMFQNMSMQCSCQFCLLPQTHQVLESATQMGPSTDSISSKTNVHSLGKNFNCSDVPSQHLSKNGEDVANSGQDASMELEWVVKRRSDGSRYITRRPVRNRSLKEHVRRMEDDRSWQTTTDDDASSEHKMGRYWTKEDRRRHMEKNRIRRREKEAVARQRAAQSGVQCTGIEEQPNIMQLSQKKMMKCKGKKVFDDFTTLQELLTHGSRDPRQTRPFNHLLSVTTV